jgi:predicted amidohydrolase YtcJ
VVDLLRRPEGLLLRDVEVDGTRTDVLVSGGSVRRLGTRLAGAPGVSEVDGRGGALLPGLNDHHLHLLATAAGRTSVACGPPAVRDVGQLRLALSGGTDWIRGTGYHESVAGPLDRALLDQLAPQRPVRVQHRSGALWGLNSPALDALGITDAPDGLLWRGDERLRDRERSTWPDLAGLGRDLARTGVLGVTDATPDLAPAALDRLVQADLPQRVLLLGAPDDWEPGSASLSRGPRKVLLHDEADLDVPHLVAVVRAAHAVGRPVAMHTVTQASCVAVLTALQEAGALEGDRIEHAGVVPPELLGQLVDLGVRVVTQPALAAAHGDDHLRDADPADHDALWRYASLLRAGVPTAPSTDAPYGPGDVWDVLRAARDRHTPSGRVAGSAERVPVATALAGLLSPLEDPGGPPRQVRPGVPADLVLLELPLAASLRDPCRDLVRLVLAAR